MQLLLSCLEEKSMASFVVQHRHHHQTRGFQYPQLVRQQSYDNGVTQMLGKGHYRPMISSSALQELLPRMTGVWLCSTSSRALCKPHARFADAGLMLRQSKAEWCILIHAAFVGNECRVCGPAQGPRPNRQHKKPFVRGAPCATRDARASSGTDSRHGDWP